MVVNFPPELIYIGSALILLLVAFLACKFILMPILDRKKIDKIKDDTSKLNEKVKDTLNATNETSNPIKDKITSNDNAIQRIDNRIDEIESSTDTLSNNVSSEDKIVSTAQKMGIKIEPWE
jgi:septal ring factor EnvC (AmiA/AmiB activator)